MSEIQKLLDALRQFALYARVSPIYRDEIQRISTGLERELDKFAVSPRAVIVPPPPPPVITMTQGRMIDQKLWPQQPKNPNYRRLANGTDWRWNSDTHLWEDISWARARLHNPPPKKP